MARCSRNTCGRWRPDVALRLFHIGARIDRQWFCSNRCIKAEALDRLSRPAADERVMANVRTPLGTLLVGQCVIDASQLKRALLEQRRSGLKLGEQVVQLGYASRDSVLRVLAAQSGVPYLAAIDVAAVRLAPGGLGIDEVRALGVVPFREVGERLLVACRAPLPRAAAAALRSLTGREVEPYMVSDEALDALQQEYGTVASPTVPTTTARDISDGATRIAAVAAEAGDVSLREAHVDPFTWVRIAADGQISTLLVPPFPQEIEEHESWLAATTRH